MSFLDSFHHQISGNPNGHKLVFLHGLMGSAANWRRIAQAFESDYHILTFDQRGHGRSFHPPTGYSPKDYAQDLKLILNELGWTSIALVGHSMGGRNALEFASIFANGSGAASHKVTALVIEDIGPDANYAAVERIEKLLSLVPTPFETRQQARDFFENQYADLISFYPGAAVVSRFLLSNIEQKPNGKMDWRFAKEAILKSMQEGRREDRWDVFANLKMPVLVVRGENSTDLTRPIYERMIALRPNIEGVEIANSGHWVHFDQPEEFIEVLKAFFKRSIGANL